MRRLLRLLTLLLIALPPARAQMCTSQNEVSFTLDPGRIWDFNRYEGSRWGLGLGVEFPLWKDMEKPLLEQRRLSLDGWAGYGVRDKAWKYGVEACLKFPHSPVDKIYLGWTDDLERLDNRNIESLRQYNGWMLLSNPGFVGDRYAHVRRLSAGLGLSWRRSKFDLCARLSQEHDVSNNGEVYRLAEGRLIWNWRKDFSVELTLGHVIGVDMSEGSTASLPRNGNYYRLLTQYARLGKEHRWGRLGGFAQAGLAPKVVPPGRHFDLGGTYGCPVHFRNTFLTVDPGYTDNRAFALGFLHYYTPAFYHSRLSNPRLFLQAGAMVGDKHFRRGLSELGLGLDRVIRWGVLDLGVAGACQVYPETRFALLGVATLIFDE